MTQDPLQVILRGAGVQGSIFCRAELGAPWALRTRGFVQAGKPTAIFHAIVRGAGWVHVEPSDAARAKQVRGPVAWRAGDLVVMPHGDPHVMSDEPDTTPVSIADLDAPAGADGLPCVTHGGDGPTTSILCGTLQFSESARESLLPHLPPLLHARGSAGPTASWLDATLRMIGAELEGAQPGAASIVARLADVLFIQALREWIAETPAREAGWLGGLNDPSVARAIAAIHTDPSEDWTAASLARVAGVSRSSLYSRFNEGVGESPASYVLRWRMHVARQSLAEPGATVRDVAEHVGYGSEAAFSRAFKRHTGSSPSVWRASANP